MKNLKRNILESERKERLGLLFIILGFGLLILSSGLALKEYFLYRVQITLTSNVQSILAFLSSELLVLIVKVAFLGVVIAASAIMLRYGLELIKEARE